MNQQLLDWVKQALEMLEDNHHLIADNEKHRYVMMHLDVIKRGKALLEQPAAWVGLEKADMPDGDNPMYDHDYFIKGMVWADIKLREKNGY